jgi:hypothetical protein
MAPKKADKPAPAHPAYRDLVFEAIKALKERTGSSRRKQIRVDRANWSLS